MKQPNESIQQEKIPYIDIAAISSQIAAISKQQGDYSDIQTVIHDYIQKLNSFLATLNDLSEQVEKLKKNQAKAEEYGEHWWEQQRSMLHTAFQDNSEVGWQKWIDIFAEALIGWALEICMRLLSEHFPVPSHAVKYLPCIQQGIKAIQTENYPATLNMLVFLLKQSSSALDDTSRAVLSAFAGRIHLYKTLKTQKAQRYFTRAQKLAPNDGRVNAALADYHRVQTEYDRAEQLYQRAIENSPDQPDGYIGMGLLSEEYGWWDDVEDWYTQAIEKVRIEKDINSALHKLLSPSSGNLYLHLAETLKDEEPEIALSAIDTALERGIRGDGDYPEYTAYKLKAEILKALNSKEKAAEAYYNAAQRLNWRNADKPAAALFEQANQLNPDHLPTYWGWADALWRSSYQSDPLNPDPQLIRQSKVIWENGAKIEWPGSDYYWAYATHAVINEELAKQPDVIQEARELVWEAIIYLEQAIFFNDQYAYAWVCLGRLHRSFYIDTESSALYATQKALGYTPDDPYGLDERAAILANVGMFDEAEEVIDKRRQLEQNTWADSVKAYILIDNNKPEAAVELMKKAIKDEPDSIWNRSLYARCKLKLGKREEANKEYQWIWERPREPSNRQYQSDFGWAAYKLGLLDDAISIFNKLRGNINYDQYDIVSNLGLCYLSKGDIQAGEKNLNTAIVRAVNLRQLDDLLEELEGIREGAAILLSTGRVRKKIQQKRGQLEQQSRSTEVELKAAVEAELRQAIAAFEQTGKTTNSEWAGLQVGLARLTSQNKVEQYWKLKDIWSKWKGSPDRAGAFAQNAAPGQYMAKHYQLAQTTPRLPAVTPIVLELGHGLVPTEYENIERDWVLFNTYIPQMRERILNQTGVQVSSIRVRGNEEGVLPATNYIITLNEVPLIMDQVQVEKRYCPVSSKMLQTLGIPGDVLGEAPHPITRELGCWVQREHWKTVTNNGLELWDDPLVYAVYHLEATLHRNLADFLGVQEVRNLLEIWQKKDRDGFSLIEAALPDQTARLRFARLLRSLVKERVAITDWKAILEVFQSIDRHLRYEADGCLRAVRIRLKTYLPGNQQNDNRLELPLETENVIAQWIQKDDGKQFFAIPLEDTQELLASLRKIVDPACLRQVLVTHRPETRPFVRRLVELEFPYLMVISQEELLSRGILNIEGGGYTYA